MARYETLPFERVDHIALRIYDPNRDGLIDQMMDEVMAQIIYKNPHLATQRVHEAGVVFDLPNNLTDLLANTP